MITIRGGFLTSAKLPFERNFPAVPGTVRNLAGKQDFGCLAVLFAEGITVFDIRDRQVGEQTLQGAVRDISGQAFRKDCGVLYAAAADDTAVGRFVGVADRLAFFGDLNAVTLCKNSVDQGFGIAQIKIREHHLADPDWIYPEKRVQCGQIIRGIGGIRAGKQKERTAV